MISGSNPRGVSDDKLRSVLRRLMLPAQNTPHSIDMALVAEREMRSTINRSSHKKADLQVGQGVCISRCAASLLILMFICSV